MKAQYRVRAGLLPWSYKWTRKDVADLLKRERRRNIKRFTNGYYLYPYTVERLP